MKKLTIQQFLEQHIRQYSTKEEFEINLCNLIEDLKEDGTCPAQLAFYKRVRNKLAKIRVRLEEIRKEINNECVSTGEILELQSLVKFISNDDVQLLEWAGVEEFTRKNLVD